MLAGNPWREMIPMFSFLWLKGRCRRCRAPIGWRYPTVELLTPVLFVWSFHRYGLSVQALAWPGFCAAVLTLAAIGVWLGWSAVLSVVLIACITGIAAGLWWRARNRLADHGVMPCGPLLALGAGWAMVFGPQSVLPI